MTVTRTSRLGANGGRAGTSGWSRDDLIFFLVFLAVTASVTVVNVLTRIDDLARYGGAPGPAWQPLVWELTSVSLIAALVPVMMWLTRRHAPRRPPPWGWIGVHALALVVFSAIHVVGMGGLRAIAYRLVDARYDALGPLANWPYELRKDALIYLILMASYATWRVLRAPPQPAPEDPLALEVRDGVRRFFVPVDDILWVEAAGNYVELHRASGSVLHRAPLQEIEARLAGRGLVRIHRSRLVRRSAIAQTQTKPSGDFTVTLRDGRVLAGSRRYRAALDAASA